MSEKCVITPYFDCDNGNESIEQAIRKTIVKEVGSDNVGFRVFIACGGGDDFSEITDTSIIAEITDTSNWDMTGYIGSTAGLVEFNYYKDLVNKTYYLFDGSSLIKWNINDNLQ